VTACHTPDSIRTSFDEEHLVANAGLLLPATLMQRLGVRDLLDEHIDLGGVPVAANVGLKGSALVAALLAGAKWINDHHRRLHDGPYQIGSHPDAGVIFERPGGEPILRRPPGVDPEVPRDAALRAVIPSGSEPRIDVGTARATDAGAPMDLGYVVSAVLDSIARAPQLLAAE
jgi:hypothetical protein